MTHDSCFDVIIVGSGPAGVSAAFPLLEAGLRVLLLDGGRHAKDEPPLKDFISWRTNDTKQADRVIGRDLHALKTHDGDSPKLRVPALAYVFDKFLQSNHIVGDGFTTVGSMATGGLSNAWGCGVARLSAEEMLSFPFHASEMDRSYKAIINRIGVSGCISDDLSEYYGIDNSDGQEPIDLDDLHAYLIRRYKAYTSKECLPGFKLGRTRLAALSNDRNGRLGCTRCSNCLWGCSRNSLYSATIELPSLMKYSNFQFVRGVVVSELAPKDGCWAVNGSQNEGADRVSFVGKRVVLAAGTLATTRLALKSLNYSSAVPVLSCPTAAFMLWLPRFLGARSKTAFGLGQLSFSLALNDRSTAFGATFSTLGIPVSEFLRHIPFRARYGADVLKNLLSSCVVGNMFIPGDYGSAHAQLSVDGYLRVSHSVKDELGPILKNCKANLSHSYRKIGALMLPGSFTIGNPGGDIHYSGTLPMRKNPRVAETGPHGEINGMAGVYVVDGSVLPILPAKPHTLTIMANADRIASKIVRSIQNTA